ARVGHGVVRRGWHPAGPGRHDGLRAVCSPAESSGAAPRFLRQPDKAAALFCKGPSTAWPATIYIAPLHQILFLPSHLVSPAEFRGLISEVKIIRREFILDIRVHEGDHFRACRDTSISSKADQDPLAYLTPTE